MGKMEAARKARKAPSSNGNVMAGMIGQRVMITGLQAKPDFNGQEGTVTSWEGDRERCAVRTDAANILVKPANLHAVENHDHHLQLAGAYGEYLEAGGRYDDAIALYFTLFPDVATRDVEDELATLWYNIGLAYKRAFRWRSAFDAYVTSIREADS